MHQLCIILDNHTLFHKERMAFLSANTALKSYRHVFLAMESSHGLSSGLFHTIIHLQFSFHTAAFRHKHVVDLFGIHFQLISLS